MKLPTNLLMSLAVSFGSLFLTAVSAATPAPAPQPQPQTSPPPPAQADDTKEDEEGEVIVTGTRVPKSVDKIPGAITVIGKQEIDHTSAITPDATAVLARTIPGYAESSQAMSNTGENLRGRIALRLFDGVPQGSPLREGTRNGTFTDMGVIARIEVINGPSASEGIGASGGIINYISQAPTKNGTDVRVIGRYTSQFEDDSEGWKFGINVTHKNDTYDMLLATSFIDRGMTWDGNSRRIGLNTSGSVADSEAKNLFFKVGTNFGSAEDQRLQFSLSRFKIDGKANYFLVDGDRATGETNTSVRGSPLGSKAELNDFTQETLSYTHGNLFGGVLSLTAYRADQAMRYVTENGTDRQDPLIAPLGTLIDQSEIDSKKKGLRTGYAYSNLFGVQGFEVNGGIDWVEDVAQQRLALTNRVWVPPMEYTSLAPYLQLSYDIGPFTFTGGLRQEDGELHVDDYTTTWFRDRRFVEGGTLDYTETLTNFGAVARLPMGFSVFASYGKGFTLPNVGIPLRNAECSNDVTEPNGTQPDGCPNDPQLTVAGILDLQAVIADNREAGFNWRGGRASLGGSYYMSDSDFGVSLAVDPVSNDFVMLRRPVEIKGYELSGEFRLSDAWRFTGLFSHTEGMTRTTNTGPLIREMGVLDINPDKIGLAAHWKFSEKGDMTLGSTTLLSRDLNEGAAGEEHTDGYTLFDYSANYKVGEGGTLTLGVENVTNKFYILSWSQVVGFRNFWSGRGRVASLTYTLNF